MMREILFRGKLIDNGEWVEGYYIHLHKTTYCFSEDYERAKDNDIHQIVFEHMTDWGLPNQHLRADVDPSTVGQYTGLTDKNGKRIFEGDILKYEDTDGGHSLYDTRWEYHRWLVFEHDGFSVDPDDLDEGFCVYAEVIGNIHDNPELLEGGNGDE